MTELLLSDITRMGDRFCVIGIDRQGTPFRSVRPIPNRSFGWRGFPYKRADRVIVDLSETQIAAPHIEDRSAWIHGKAGSAGEQELVDSLKDAEVAGRLNELFGCQLHPSPRGSDALYVNPNDARRSICGCAIKSIRFSFRFHPRLRAALMLDSGETLPNLPVVDRDWMEFVDLLTEADATPATPARLERFFNATLRERILSAKTPFARIGLARPDRDGLCWLMLDSLFPLPDPAWRQAFK